MIKRNLKYREKAVKAAKYLLPKTLKEREQSFKVFISAYIVCRKSAKLL